MPKTIAIPTDFAVGSNISFRAGPTAVVRSGVVTGHEGQFVLVRTEAGKSLKTRPASIIA